MWCEVLFDGVTHEGGPLNADVNKSMMKFVRQAHAKYTLALEANKQKQTEGEKRREERKRILREITDAMAAKKAAIDSIKGMLSSYDAKIDSLKKMY